MAAPYLIERKWQRTRRRHERWALVVEALGMMLPGGATAPAVSADRRRIAEATGALIGTAVEPRQPAS